jgi:hypothetical protein
VSGARAVAFDVSSSGSLSSVADTVKEVIESNSDQQVSELESDDDFVALSVGGVDPSDDNDTAGFQPVVVVDAGDGEYQVTGISRDNDLLDGLDDALPNAEGALQAADMDVETVREEFQREVNMSAEDIREWGDHPCSDTASLEPESVRQRVIDVLETDADDWNQETARKASKVISFISRMSSDANRPDDVNEGPHGCPSEWSVSLMNWGFRPPDVSIPNPDSVDIGGE